MGRANPIAVIYIYMLSNRINGKIYIGKMGVTYH